MITVGISDNHGIYDYREVYSEVELLIVSGDLFSDDTWQSERDLVEIVNKLQKHFPNTKIIIVPGNHDYVLELITKSRLFTLFRDDVSVLIDEGLTYGNLKLWGNSRTYLHQAFRRKMSAEDIDIIPRGLDILITHDAPRCFELDFIKPREGHSEPGCLELYNKVLEVKPRYHFFGHIHHSGIGVVNGINFYNNSQLRGNKFTPQINMLDIMPA